MSLSIYEIVILPMIHGLGVMDDYIGHAEKLAEAKQVPVEEILDARLAPDMLTFEEQILAVCNKVEAHVSKLARTERPPIVKVQSTAAALRARVADTVRYLNGISEGASRGPRPIRSN
jgi:hypothetical protein